MRRVVSQTPSVAKSTWFSCTPISISSPEPAMRASSCERAARDDRLELGHGSLENVGLLHREPVRVGRRHDELAAPRTATRMPVSTGRDSSRDAARATRAIVSSSDSRSTANVATASTSGRRGKSSALYVLQRVARAAGGDVHDRLGRLVLDRHLVARQQPRDVDERLARQDDRRRRLRSAPATVARSESSMSVAARRSSAPRASSRIPDRICTDVRVDSARETTPSACDELVLRAR